LLPKPGVPAARAVWLQQLHRLASLPGADVPLITKVKDWVLHGVRAEFKGSPPPPAAYANTYSFSNSLPVCLERLKVQVDLGALEKLSAPPPPGGYVQPLHAVFKAGKKPRICVDLARNFNDFVVDCPFQYASVQAAVDLASQCPVPAWFVKLDITACFLSFPIHEADRDFFICEAGGDFYRYLCVAFGLKSAPYVVTLLLDVVSSALSDLGIEHVRYLDDFLLVATSAARAWASAHTAATVIASFGLALAPVKVEGPFQRVEFLGIVIDSTDQSLGITSERRDELVILLTSFQRCRFSSVRRLQSLLGKLHFASTVLPGSRPFLRRIIDTIGPNERGRRRLDSSFRCDVRYWAAHIDLWNGRARWRTPTQDPFVFASDASTRGFAYGLESAPHGRVLPQSFSPGALRAGIWAASNGDRERQATSAAIQYGEFFCVTAAAIEFGHLLADSHVIFVVDNGADVHVINRHRTRDPGLSVLLRALCDASLRYNFSFSAVHRPGVKNVLMDWASRPEMHHYAFDPATVPPASPASDVVGGVASVAASVAASLTRFPPLLIPTSVVLVSSRCLSFNARTSSATWALSWGNW
jgi:hypothetical protein